MTTLGSGQYFGVHGQTWACPIARITETSYGRFTALPRHAHAVPNIVLVVSGSYEERDCIGARACGVGTAVYHPVDSVHANRFGSTRTRCLNLELTERFEGSSLAQHRNPGVAQGRRLASLSRELARELAERSLPARFILDALVWEIVGELGRDDHCARSSCALDAAAMIRSEPERFSSLDPIARQLGMHPCHLARRFRRRFGCSIGAYARRQRLQRVCQMLRETDTPAGTIALRCGFADQSHLCRQFKAAMGVTPRAYRKAARN